jgi:hypothetical protein
MESLDSKFVSLFTLLNTGQGWPYESGPTSVRTSCSRVSGWKEGIKHEITYIKHLNVVNKRPRCGGSVGLEEGEDMRILIVESVEWHTHVMSLMWSQIEFMASSYSIDTKV